MSNRIAVSIFVAMIFSGIAGAYIGYKHGYSNGMLAGEDRGQSILMSAFGYTKKITSDNK